MQTTALKRICLAGILLTMVLAVKMPARQDDDDDLENSKSRIRQGYSIAPIRLDLRGKNRALVGLGSFSLSGCFS
jgi:hypothetical protein